MEQERNVYMYWIGNEFKLIKILRKLNIPSLKKW